MSDFYMFDHIKSGFPNKFKFLFFVMMVLLKVAMRLCIKAIIILLDTYVKEYRNYFRDIKIIWQNSFHMWICKRATTCTCIIMYTFKYMYYLKNMKLTCLTYQKRRLPDY